ncbi:S1C family serine protease [Ramlibacter alkalitolerans]|uniref:Serine protease n=1 Tax=Ramlibacter alkalitolerans TaxID=2039631 RepID=A0ABS1JX84_9BURK|nr:S1C family serine protease [Ramlibacter alkalitolerans]MBL0428696.1 serine protease [Ramlibacter alkalitolerans]
MSLLARLRALALSSFVLWACAPLALAAAPSAGEQETIDALSRAMEAVVGVQVNAAEDARSVQTLGRRRTGSGVVIGPDGLILTIGYLILEADSIQVTTQDHRVLPARPVAYDLATGFGLIRPLLPLRVQPVPLGTASGTAASAKLMAAIGGEGGGAAVTELVSTRPFSGYWEYHIEGALFTSPPVGRHSGAGLFNARGELLGIGSLFVGDALGDSHGRPGNMFVPVDLLRPILAELQQTGSTRSSRRPWLGINSTEQGGRVQIVRVSEDGPAFAAGLAEGDIVLAIDGEKVSTLEGFYKKLWSRPEAEGEVTLTVLKGTQIRQVPVKTMDRMKTMRRPAGI